MRERNETNSPAADSHSPAGQSKGEIYKRLRASASESIFVVFLAIRSHGWAYLKSCAIYVAN